jgi:hypothetical protein
LDVRRVPHALDTFFLVGFNADSPAESEFRTETFAEFGALVEAQAAADALKTTTAAVEMAVVQRKLAMALAARDDADDADARAAAESNPPLHI